MKKIKLYLLLATVILGAITPVFTLFAQDEAPYGPWLDEILFSTEANEANVYSKLLQGDMDIYMSDFSDADLYTDARASEDLDYDISYGLFFELRFNPYGPEFSDGSFNPFSNEKIREAMNMMIDRDYIVDEIMQGLGKSKLLPIVSAFPDYGKLAEVAVQLESKYAYNPEAARETIFRELSEMGAQNVAGKWTYNGTDIVLKMLIRTEDQRLQIGDYAADALEDLGFTTERNYKISSEASPIWYSGNPADGLFHVYTGGWISTVVSRDDSDNFAYFYTDMGLPGPLWQAYGSTSNPLYYEAAGKLDRGDWATWEERMELMRKCAAWALEDSAVVWTVDQISPWLKTTNVEVAADLSAGYNARISTLTLRFKDEVGGSLKAGAREVFTEPWNQEAGTNWVYDMIVMRPTTDSPEIRNPYTGLPMPCRFVDADIEVLAGTPTTESSDWLDLTFVDSIEVPTDAWYDWDSTNDQVIFAPADTTAVCKVVVNYGDVIGNEKYHDGSVMTLADWLVQWPLDFEQADPDSDLYDVSTVADFGVWKGTFKGMKVISESPLVIEYYNDFVNNEAEFMVTRAAFARSAISGFQTPIQPWQVTAIGTKADEEGLLAYSAQKADILDIEWMNYIGGPSLAILSDVLDDAMATGYVPFGDFEDLVTPEEATARYQNLKDWYEDKDHFWVSYGPYYLDQADYVAHTAVLKANRDYPYKADRWSWLSAPPIPESDATVPDFVIPGLDASFTLDLSFGGAPYSNDRIDFVKYMVVDSAGELKTVGEAEPSATEGQWTIDLEGTETDGLSTGSYNLVTIALSKDVAMPGTAETPFIVIPLVSYFQSILATTEAEFAMDIAELESTLGDTQGTTAEIQDSITDLEDSITDLQDAIDAIDIPTDVSGLADKISSLQTTTYAAIGAAIIAILIAAYAFMTKK